MQTFKIVVTPDGRIQFLAQDGSFGDGKAAIEQMLADLQAAGIEVTDASAVENHREMEGVIHEVLHETGGHSH